MDMRSFKCTSLSHSPQGMWIHLQDYTKRYSTFINIYAQNIITRHAVNKQHSLGMTIENKEPNILRERNQHTRPSLCRHQSAVALLIMYFTGFNIYTDVYIVTLTFYIDM